MKKLLIIFLTFLSVNIFAEEKTSEYIFNGKLGLSPYTGVVGLEVQKNKWSLGFGLPASVSLKRYVNENEDSLFYGVYWNNFSNNNYDDTENGIFFERYERKEFGIGAGYIWIWESGWNTSTGLSVGDFEEEFTNSDVKLIKTGVRINLELSVGYRF